MLGKEIMQEIDSTLDQLIQNAEMIQNVEWHELSETEAEAFQKTQESLLHHLMRMDQTLQAKKQQTRPQHEQSANNRIRQKYQKFEQLKTEYNKSISQTLQSWHRPDLLSKRRNKRFLKTRSSG